MNIYNRLVKNYVGIFTHIKNADVAKSGSVLLIGMMFGLSTVPANAGFMVGTLPTCYGSVSQACDATKSHLDALYGKTYLETDPSYLPEGSNSCALYDSSQNQSYYFIETFWDCTCGNTPNCVSPPPVPKKNPGPHECASCPCDPSPLTNNPIHTGTGNKYWFDTDYVAGVSNGMRFGRQYNSQNAGMTSTLGAAWHHTYDSTVTHIRINGVSAVLMARANGKAYGFTGSGMAYTAQDTGITDRIVGIADSSNSFAGYRYTVVADNSIETYDVNGQLQSIQDRTGMIQTLTYSDATTPATIASQAGLLIRVTDTFGRQLNFTYDSGNRISAMNDPANGLYKYAYDANNNLSLVTYPDNKTKTYLYDESANTGGTNLPNALTGIMDENNIRYASYYYDTQGRAYQEQHAGGVDQYQIGYSTDGSNSTVTDPLGTTRTTNFTNILGVIKVTGQSQPGGAGCGGAANAITYDSNGNVASRTDFNGNKTTYTYDLNRNLETSRTEASGTAQARTISTQWNPTYRLPIAINEPLRKTTFNYDPSGNLLNKAVQATTDVNGSQGFSAQTTGTARTWSYTYNQYGQVLAATGPRTDVVDKTTYSYDSATGNLLTITNAAGQVTNLSNYDLNGRVETITDPNGLTTNLSYYPRGWLKSKVVSTAGSNQTTNYNYDGVGQLIGVTLPDNSTITYTYDPAHRLTDIADSLGNTIHYTLDAMGNRINEQVKDPQATLTRQTTRVFDALNRLQQVTGVGQ